MPNKFSRIIEDGARDLFPAYFSLVMATGIVSIACFLYGMDYLAFPLFYLNQFFYVTLWLLTIYRLFRYPSHFIAYLSNHGLSTGFLTIVAGTNVLGSQFIILTNNLAAASALWIIGSVFWLLLIYAIFIALTVKAEKPPLEKGINGTWLLFVVSTQSIPVLGMLIQPAFSAWQEVFAFTMFCLYLLGCMLYILIITLIFYRFMFYKLDPQELTPPYWINMGAVAITTLAGANIIIKSQSPFLLELMPFIKGFTLFFWASGTWWIPFLFLMGIWRHLHKQFPFTYNPAYWGLVFPMGMYTVSSFRLAQALELDFLYLIPRYFVYIAIAAWFIVFYGLTLSLIRKFKTQATV